MKHFPIEKHYRDYKYFHQTKFKNDLQEKLSPGLTGYQSFENIFSEIITNMYH